MHNTFLHNVARELLALPDFNPGECKIIFPNKRPEYYFRKAIRDIAGKEMDFAEISSIEDFIGMHSSPALSDPLELLFILYNIHRQYKPEEEFDKFHNWGNMLLKDYDEIDKYLIDPKRFFSNLGAVKELEETEQDEEVALQFWSTINRQNPTELQEKFLMHWEIFEKVYYDFTAYLQENGKAYPGMQYREAATRFENKEYDKGIVKYIFIGFNALSRAEEFIIRGLLRENKALVYFDTDEYYLKNKEEEAGHFIRKSLKNLRVFEPKIVADRLGKEKKDISIIGVPLEASQAKALEEKLRNANHVGTTAIIVPDENMLQPLLHAFPDNLSEVNFTLGRPLNISSLYTLFEAISSLHENFNPAIQSFFYKDVLAVLGHPYIHAQSGEEMKALIEEIESFQVIYVDRKRIAKYSVGNILKVIFEQVNSTPALFLYLEKIINELHKNNSFAGRESEELLFRELLNGLKGFLLNQEVSVTPSTFWRFFRQQASQIKIQINLDMPDAMQVMGMLETRALNFDNIYILSVNEGNLPATRHSHSYIPYDIRKDFGLPTFDEQEALSTYYFYRLLQGAGNIHLFYNSERGSNGAEPSRYIRQLEYFLARKNPNVNIKRESYSLPLKNHSIKPIEFIKDKAYFAELMRKANESGISPTFISTYYTCSLQFFLNYIAKLKPPVSIDEEMEADRFGTLFHAVMEEIYTPYIGSEITMELIKKERANIVGYLKKTMADLHWDSDYFTDKNSLLIESIEVLVRKALDADEKYAPFYVLAMEKKLTHELQVNDATKIKLQGTIDRIDEKNGVVRIMDYKTGNVQKFSFNYENEDEMLSKQNKEAFQTVFYSYLYYKNTGTQSLQPVILPLKKVSEGYKNVNPEKGVLNKADLEKFEIKLKEILLGIMDITIPVTQIDDLGVCSYCDYKNICLI